MFLTTNNFRFSLGDYSNPTNWRTGVSKISQAKNETDLTARSPV
jgi:hypothetical protein